jgi:hypothetical protein
MAEKIEKKETEEDIGELAENPQKESAEEPASDSGTGSNFLSPISLIMFFFAGLIDLAGFLLLLTGLDDLGILDILGLIFVGGLMFISSGSMTDTKGSQQIKKKLFKKLGLAFLFEIIPYVGGLSPSWTIATYKHLKGK